MEESTIAEGCSEINATSEEKVGDEIVKKIKKNSSEIKCI